MTGRILLIAMGLALMARPAAAQQTAVAPGAAPAVAPLAASAPARSILFVGNSFTYGALSPVRRYRAETVTDLNQSGIGGVPALFKRFTDQAGLAYAVSLETASGMGLDYHYTQKRALIDKAWDVVILQDFSTLDRAKPGDSGLHRRFAALLAKMIVARNPAVDIELSATWSRADLVYKPGSPWSGQPIDRMAADLRRAADQARAASRQIRGVIPIGEAWSRAIVAGLADPNPYDGIGFGQIDLWSYDQYHASAYGYYLEALLVFGRVTGLDPRSLGVGELAADDLGFAPGVTLALQRIAADQLASETALSRR
ncbi:DUF4886 domain-containing protein [Sphingomonas sp. 28-63-12]|uniref:DUF4886 domain-containing protein n=1 Tax=Sphingomonas sp. 28-63-12 TaxID=1970434 RepID=UPI0035A94804